MKAFGNYHPFILMTYFLSVLLIAMFCENPVIQMLALTGGLLFCALIQSRSDRYNDLKFYVPLAVLVSVTNPLFSHNGETPLFFMNGNPVTLEAFVYGIAISVMVIGVLLWCKAYSKIMTSDKFLFMFGRALPKLSLVLSMALRFVPMLIKQMKQVSRVQKAMGLYASKSYIDKIKSALRVMSALITWSIENAVDTSASMKARGYGTKGRSHFALYRFTRCDAVVLSVCTAFLMTTFLGIGFGAVNFNYYPSIAHLQKSPLSVLTYIAYGIMSFLPSIVEIKENVKWKYYISKI